MNKKIVRLIIIVCLLVCAFTGTAFARSYNFLIEPPYVGSLVSTFLYRVDTGTPTPYINPSISSTPTNYVLSPERYSSTVATNFRTNISTPGYRSFTYNSGYGGVGTSYCLSGYPTYFEYATYIVYGDWSEE